MPLLDWLFPTSCLCCGEEGVQLCPKCCAHLPKLEVDPPTPEGLDYVRCATAYAAPVSDAIHALKYGSASSLGPILGELMADSLSHPTTDDLRPTISEPLLIPIPIHRRRQRERGFNQAELLAREVSSAYGWDLRSNILVRTRYTPPQAKLDRAARQTNLHGAFTVIDLDAVRGRNVVLVDDVLTTGSTLTACAVALKDSGAATVGGLCLAYDAPTSTADR